MHCLDSIYSYFEPNLFYYFTVVVSGYSYRIVGSLGNGWKGESSWLYVVHVRNICSSFHINKDERQLLCYIPSAVQCMADICCNSCGHGACRVHVWKYGLWRTDFVSFTILFPLISLDTCVYHIESRYNSNQPINQYINPINQLINQKQDEPMGLYYSYSHWLNAHRILNLSFRLKVYVAQWKSVAVDRTGTHNCII